MIPEKSIDVIRPGQIVRICDDEISCTVLQVNISKQGVKYQVSWWSGRDRKESWVCECEISKPEKPQLQTIGFSLNHGDDE